MITPVVIRVVLNKNKISGTGLLIPFSNDITIITNHDKLKIPQINFDQLMEIESKKNGYFYFPVSEYMKNREKELGEDFDKHEYSDTGHYNSIGHREWGLILSKRICNHWEASRSQTLIK